METTQHMHFAPECCLEAETGGAVLWSTLQCSRGLGQDNSGSREPSGREVSAWGTFTRDTENLFWEQLAGLGQLILLSAFLSVTAVQGLC